MDIRKLILTNGFTIKELLKIKTCYLSKKRIVCRYDEKIQEGRSFDRFILLVAELCRSGFFWIYLSLMILTPFAFFLVSIEAGCLMLVVWLLPILNDFFLRSWVAEFNIKTIVKLSILRMRMRWYKIKPPEED